jgi:cysteine desulfurase/selenocysteine lyase
MPDPKPLIYFDNAATSFPKPAPVVEAMSDFLANRAVNPGRSGFDLSLETGRMVDEVRGRLDRFFNNPAAAPDRAVFTANATDALNLAIQGICCPGDHVVATVLEHNSVLRPLAMLQKAGIITFDLVPCDMNGFVDPAAVEAAIAPATRLVIMTHASNVCGAVQPAHEVGALCRDRGILFLLDAAQTAGLIPVDMTALQVDLVAFTGHKSLLGPTGIGGLIVGPDVHIRSTRWGGTGVRSASVEHPEDYPWRLEAGTLNTVGISGLAAAMDWIQVKGIDSILKHERELADRFLAGTAGLEKIEVHGCGDSHSTALGADRLPVISITVPGRPVEQIGLFLDNDWNIAVRTGLHCAPLAHEAMGTAPEGTVRISFGPFNTTSDVDVAVTALKDFAG